MNSDGLFQPLCRAPFPWFRNRTERDRCRLAGQEELFAARGLRNDQFTRRAVNHSPFASRDVNVDSVPLSKRSTRTVPHGQADIPRLLPTRKRTLTGVVIDHGLCLLPCSAKVILSKVIGDSVMPAVLRTTLNARNRMTHDVEQ